MDAIEALMQYSAAMLEGLQGEFQEEDLLRFLDGRQERLDALAAAVSCGATATPAQTLELRRLDGEILARLLDRRNAICGEMAALQMARSASLAYRSARPETAMYLDRAG